MATATTMTVGLKPFPSEPPPTQQKTEYDLSFSVDADDDLYSRLKMLQRQHEFIEIQEEYVKDDLKNLRRELLRSQEEVKRIQSVPLHIRTIVPSTLQLSAMATQMLVINPVLSLAFALVIPSMALSWLPRRKASLTIQ
ncbi:26s proteasome regulatory subunit 6B [Orobanche hederae]